MWQYIFQTRAGSVIYSFFLLSYEKSEKCNPFSWFLFLLSFCEISRKLIVNRCCRLQNFIHPCIIFYVLAHEFHTAKFSVITIMLFLSFKCDKLPRYFMNFNNLTYLVTAVMVNWMLTMTKFLSLQVPTMHYIMQFCLCEISSKSCLNRCLEDRPKSRLI